MTLNNAEEFFYLRTKWLLSPSERNLNGYSITEEVISPQKTMVIASKAGLKTLFLLKIDGVAYANWSISKERALKVKKSSGITVTNPDSTYDHYPHYWGSGE